jgi:hypothetical protein
MAGVARFPGTDAEARSREGEAYSDQRVVRIYEGAVASQCRFGAEFYWRAFDMALLTSMLEAGIMNLVSVRSPTKAWAKILPGLSRDSRLVVKVNLNNTRRDWKATALNSSPAMMITLARSLTRAGMRGTNITFLDCSRPFPEEMVTEVEAQCPGVRCLGGAQAGSSDTIEMPYGGPFVIPQVVMDAEHLISCHLMKKHDGGHTGAIKNLFGLKADGRVTFAHRDPGWMNGDQCRRIITHPEIRKRLKLNLCEALLAAKSPDTLDPYGFVDLFPEGKPSSLMLSRSPYHQDVVAWDFVRAECSRFDCRPGDSIQWLKGCAGAVPQWNVAAIESGRLVAGAPGLPPKDLVYDPAVLEYVSRTAASALTKRDRKRSTEPAAQPAS